MPRTPADQSQGRYHLTVALRLAGLAWLAMSFQEVLLFARPTPYGSPYAERWWRYFPLAISYNMLGVMLVSALPLLGWLLWNKRQVRSGVARAVHAIQLGLLMFTVALDQADNEIMRFMGMHLSLGLVHTYYRVNAWGTDMLHIFATDRGGPWLPFLILIAAPLVLWWAGRRVIHESGARRWPWPVTLTLCLLPLCLPLMVHKYGRGQHFVWRRTRPAIITIAVDLKANLSRGHRPHGFEAEARNYQTSWLQNSGDRTWRFSDAERPLVRVPLTPAPSSESKPWDVIYIQLETFRGWDTGFLRPDISPSPTPFLDRLARDSGSAFWRRYLSVGLPTVNALMAGLCSIKPHSSANISVAFTYTALDCLPAVLRRHGYAAEYFTGSDPDWDGESVWLRRWFDEYHYYRDSRDADRVVFRRAAERIRELGRGTRPFFAVVVSISNHYPFRSREPQFTIDSPDRPNQAIRNTMRYTDDVVREFIETLEREPWFARTLVVITGDHGYSLGEHGPPGEPNGWRETVWVPLVIHGAHHRLLSGGHDEPASLLDIPPTVADLLGIREPNPWIGSSLLTPSHQPRSFTVIRGSAFFGEQDRYSMVVDPANGRASLYDAIEDPLQRKDISAMRPDVVAALRRQAEDERELINYLLEVNRVWQEPQNQSGGGDTR
jgi:phosphoglycerol transferase MdoB-like AlkP superfamily enzyme